MPTFRDALMTSKFQPLWQGTGCNCKKLNWLAINFVIVTLKRKFSIQNDTI